MLILDCIHVSDVLLLVAWWNCRAQTLPSSPASAAHCILDCKDFRIVYVKEKLSAKPYSFMIDPLKSLGRRDWGLASFACWWIWRTVERDRLFWEAKRKGASEDAVLDNDIECVYTSEVTPKDAATELSPRLPLPNTVEKTVHAAHLIA